MKAKIKFIIDIRPKTDKNGVYHYFYRIRNKVTCKEYYGIHSTRDLTDGYAGSGKLLKKAIAKYGIDSFYMQVLKFFSSRTACSDYEREVVSAQYLKDFNGRTYNLVGGGENGHFISESVKEKISKSETGKEVSDATRQKLSIAALGRIPWNKGLLPSNNPLVGTKRTDKTKANISKALVKYYESHESHLKGKKRSEEFCTAVSIGKTGKKFTAEHKKHLSESHIGLHHTDETKEKIRKSSRENPRGIALPKCVLCVELNTIFKSAKEAWIALKGSYQFPNYQNFCKKIRNNIKIDGLSFEYRENEKHHGKRY